VLYSFLPRDPEDDMRHRPATLFVFTILLCTAAAAQPTPASINVLASTSCKQQPFVTVNLNGPAPAGGQVIQLSSSMPAVLSVPPTITAAAGATSANFTATCSPMQQAVAVTLTATANGGSQSAIVNVLAPVLESVSLKREQTGTNLLGAARLIGPAPAGGVIVSLVSSHPSIATFPSSVTIPAGSSAANFSVTNVNPVGEPLTFILTATGLGVTKTVDFTLQPAVPASVTFLTGQFFASSASVVGGRSQQVKVTLNGVAGGGGVNVQMTSSNLAAPVPASITITPGQTEALFFINTVPVAQTINASITATVGATTKSGTITVQAPSLDIFTASPSTLIGGQSGRGRAFVNGDAPTGGLTVSLSSSNTARATVPATVTVPAGGRETSFLISSSPLESQSSVTLTASAGGISRTTSLSIVPEGPTGLTLNPGQLVGGQSSTGQVSAVSSDDSFVVSLTSEDPAVATVPSSVSFGPGETLKSFTITTTPVIERKLITISARTSSRGTTTFSISDPKDTTFSVTRTATLTVNPPQPTQVTLNPTTVVGRTNVSGVVTLNRPAPAGLVISVSSNNNNAATPSAVSVNPGALTHTFTVATRDVIQDSSATITVTCGGVSRSAFLIVRAD
jgi:hypothetical protein